MPVIKSAKKKLRKDKKRTVANNKWRALLDNVVKKAQKTPGQENVKKAFALIDKSAKKHLIHKNKAARIKASLSKLLPKGEKSTNLMVATGWLFVVRYTLGVESIAIAYSLGGIVNLIALMVLLDRKVGGFHRGFLFLSLSKIFLATLFTGFALYIPIKLLDQLVFDTTRTVNLLMLTGISSLAGLSLYVFFNVVI